MRVDKGKMRMEKEGRVRDEEKEEKRMEGRSKKRVRMEEIEIKEYILHKKENLGVKERGRARGKKINGGRRRVAEGKDYEEKELCEKKKRGINAC